MFYRFETLLSYVKEKRNNLPVLDIDDQNKMYVFVF